MYLFADFFVNSFDCRRLQTERWITAFDLEKEIFR